MSKKKNATEAAVTESYTVFYRGEAEKISPHSKGLLTYELGKEGERRTGTHHGNADL